VEDRNGTAKKVILGTDVSIYEERCSLNETDELKLKTILESKGMVSYPPLSRATSEETKEI
jgi:hypothetical protein